MPFEKGDPTTAFELHRGRLLGLAYRMLGSRVDAEDAVQDAWLRWSATQRLDIDNAEAFLVRIVTRLCLDRLKSARSKREVYVGPWLPEPIVDAEALSSHAATELAEDLSFALLLALDRLSPLERAAFLLHDVFDVPYASVASTLGRSEDACRKLASRARLAIKRNGPVPSAPDDEHARLLAAFVEAAESGDISRIECLLTEDAVALSDGGGRVLAALNPIRGADRVARFISGVVRKQIEAGVTLRVENASINGRPGLLVWADDHLVQALAIDVDDERIATLYMVLNPDKLAALSG